MDAKAAKRACAGYIENLDLPQEGGEHHEIDVSARALQKKVCTDPCLDIIHQKAPVCKDGIFHNFCVYNL